MPRYGRTRADSCQGDQFSRRWSLTIASLQEQRDDAFWQGFALVGNCNFTDRASAAVRGEWFEDHGGSRTGALQTLYEGTVTGKYLITQHLYGQVEYRHDESAKGDAFPKDSPGVGHLPPTKFTDGQDILGFNVTYVFN